MKLITLRTGAKQSAATINITRNACIYLLAEHTVATYEAVMLARDPGHVLFGNAGEVLARAGLIDPVSGSMDTPTREIIVAMFKGELLDMRMLSPSEFLA